MSEVDLCSNFIGQQKQELFQWQRARRRQRDTAGRQVWTKRKLNKRARRVGELLQGSPQFCVVESQRRNRLLETPPRASCVKCASVLALCGWG